MLASCPGAWHSRNRTFGILRNDLWNSSRCMIGRRAMWTGGRSVWDSWSECCADWDVASHPDKAGMHIICLPVSGIREEQTAGAATTAWHAHHCELFRSKHEAAGTMLANGHRHSVYLSAVPNWRWSWRWQCVCILRWQTGYWQSASSDTFVFPPATSLTADKRAYHGSENEGNVTPCNLIDWCKCSWGTRSLWRACETPGVLTQYASRSYNELLYWTGLSLGLSHWRQNLQGGCLRTGCLGECVNKRGRKVLRIVTKCG